MQDLMPPVNTPDKLFHDGDPTQGIEGTIVTAEWLNDSQGATRDAQQELKNVLAAASLAPDESKQNQLVTAIQALISTAVDSAKYVPDVGELYITKSATDPNTKWPGTTWVYLGEGLTLRTAKADFSDLGTTAGSDSVTLSVDNVPTHSHTFSATTADYDPPASTTSSQPAQSLATSDYDFAAAGTSSFDYGSKATDGGGEHTHPLNGRTQFGSAGANVAMANTGTDQTNTWAVASSGSHGHNVYIGAHSHTIDLPPHSHSLTVPEHSHTLDLPAHSHTVSGTSDAIGAGSSFGVIQHSIMIAVWERTA